LHFLLSIFFHAFQKISTESICVPLDVQGYVLSGESMVSGHGTLDTLTTGLGVLRKAIIIIAIIIMCGK